MVYFVLIAGLILIFIALKKKPESNSQVSFKDMLNEKTEISNNEALISQIKELNERLEELESAFLLYMPEISASNNKAGEINIAETNQPVLAESEVKTAKSNNKVDDNNNNNINSQIYSLYDNGKTIEEIASFLRTGKGEVSLRLGLRKQKI
jgi:hypothetical protein